MLHFHIYTYSIKNNFKKTIIIIIIKYNLSFNKTVKYTSFCPCFFVHVAVLYTSNIWPIVTDSEQERPGLHFWQGGRETAFQVEDAAEEQ